MEEAMADSPPGAVAVPPPGVVAGRQLATPVSAKVATKNNCLDLKNGLSKDDFKSLVIMVFSSLLTKGTLLQKA
jgi:hypothetical protein